VSLARGLVAAMSREPGDRHDQILAVAAELFARKGVAATTVREIADVVGILSGSLYHHFDSKEAMVDEILTPYLKDLGEACQRAIARQADPRGKLRDLVAECLGVVEAHPHATEIYQSDVNYLSQFERFGYLTAVAAQVRQAWLEVLNDGVAQGAFRPDLDSRIVYRLMRDAIWPSVRWFRPSREYPVTTFAEDCTSLFLDGVAVPAKAVPATAAPETAEPVRGPLAARTG
jgi:TetR/AcrR family transcriptional regulator, cholesterol catabolism regulator